MNSNHPKKSHRKSMAAIAIFAVAAFVAGNFVLNNSVNAQSESLLVSTQENPDSPFSSEQLALLAKIESIQLDGSFFRNPVFVSLHDWTVELGREDAGRFNPFAPFAGEISPVNSSVPTPAGR